MGKGTLFKLRNQVRESWWKYNLNYAELEKHLLTVKKQFGVKKAVSTCSIAGEKRTFAEILDQDVEKMVLFYLRALGEFANRLMQLREYQISNMHQSPGIYTLDAIEAMCQKYRDLGQDVLDLLAYLDCNVIALRRIIKRHDKQFDLQMGRMYFGDRMGRKDSQLVQLYHQEGLYAIIGTIRRGFEDLYLMKRMREEEDEGGEGSMYIDRDATRGRALTSTRARSGSHASNASSPVRGRGSHGLLGTRRFASSTALHALLQRGGSYDRGEVSGQKHLARSLSSTFLSFLSPMRVRSKQSATLVDAAMLAHYEPVLQKMDEASLRVLQNQKSSLDEYQAFHSSMGLTLTVRDMVDSDSDDSDDGEGGPECGRVSREKRKRSKRVTSKMGLFLALFATFLYQMNQYVVAPTSGQYSDRLGMSPSLSGLIIGLSPFAALLSALVFSVWTNYSFKQPLIVCLFFLGTGNLMYALALQFNSPKMIFVGRLFTGLGVPRGIARRYIADHVSLADRTEASSQFVTAGAMGLAFGPLLSSIVSMSHFDFTYKWNDVTIIQYELVTAPGWLMAAMFYITLLVLIVFFEEPYIEQLPPTAPSTESGQPAQPANRKRGTSLLGRRPDSSFLGSNSQKSVDASRHGSGLFGGASTHGSMHGSLHGADSSRRGKKVSGKDGTGSTSGFGSGNFAFMSNLFGSTTSVKDSTISPRGAGQQATSVASSMGFGKAAPPTLAGAATPRDGQPPSTQNSSLLMSSSRAGQVGQSAQYGGTNQSYQSLPTADTGMKADAGTGTWVSGRTNSGISGRSNSSSSTSSGQAFGADINPREGRTASVGGTKGGNEGEGRNEGEGDRPRGMLKVLSLDDIAEMARANEQSTRSFSSAADSSKRSFAELTGAAQQILLSSQKSPHDDHHASALSIDETASQLTVKFAETTGPDVECRHSTSDVHSHHSGYTNHTIRSSSSAERRPGHSSSNQFLSNEVQYDQVLADFGGDIQSYHDQENAYYEYVYDDEEGDCVGWLCWLCCPSWMCWCCDVLGDEVVVILFIYLINKIGQEMVVSSVPSVAMELFGWNSQLAGFFMATMGGLVLPFNILVSKLAKEVEDRTMMTYLNYLSVASVVFILRMPFIEYSATQYVCGSIMIFVFLNALEGVIMSLLSKLVSPELARGTWNSGLLATEAGTLGRVIGDISITYFSGEAAQSDLINMLYSPVAVGMVLVVVLCARFFDQMEV